MDGYFCALSSYVTTTPDCQWLFGHHPPLHWRRNKAIYICRKTWNGRRKFFCNPSCELKREFPSNMWVDTVYIMADIKINLK